MDVNAFKVKKQKQLSKKQYNFYQIKYYNYQNMGYNANKCSVQELKNELWSCKLFY